MQSTGHASTHDVSLVPMQGSAITYAIGLKFSNVSHGPSSRGVLRERPNYGLRNRLRFQPLGGSGIDSYPNPGLRAFHGQIRALQHPVKNIEAASAEARDR